MRCNTIYRYSKWIWPLAGLIVFGLAACGSNAPLATDSASEPLPVAQTQAAAPAEAPGNLLEEAPAPSPTPAATNTATLAPEPTASPTPAPVFYEPAGCLPPPEDGARVQINGFELSARTYAMLQQADLLYTGEIDVSGKAITQGSYTTGSLDGPDVHLGGGEVDLSVTGPHLNAVLYNEIEPLIRALRTAGFAAWLRPDDVSDGGPEVYIHAIAIGDQDLSPAAQEQVSGPAGYLSGYDGLPETGGDPRPDPHGGPLVCRWMQAAGYADLRSPALIATQAQPWQERLRQAAEKYLAPYPEDAEVIARSLNFLDGKSESAENICGPLSAAILRDAGLLPNQAGPVQELKSFWQARPSTNGRPWSLFPESDYEVFRYDTPLAEFDFKAWPLQPGDFLYTYARAQGFEHMFVVTEVDAEGRAYTVTNQYQAWGNEIWGTMLIQRYMLYDPQKPGDGIIYNEWSDRKLGMTGHFGFEVLRKRGLAAGTLYAYTARPGDTLPDLAARFGASLESLVQANPGLDLTNLQVGQQLTIPIPTFPLDSP